MISPCPRFADYSDISPRESGRLLQHVHKAVCRLGHRRRAGAGEEKSSRPHDPHRVGVDLGVLVDRSLEIFPGRSEFGRVADNDVEHLVPRRHFSHVLNGVCLDNLHPLLHLIARSVEFGSGQRGNGGVHGHHSNARIVYEDDITLYTILLYVDRPAGSSSGRVHAEAGRVAVEVQHRLVPAQLANPPPIVSLVAEEPRLLRVLRADHKLNAVLQH